MRFRKAVLPILVIAMLVGAVAAASHFYQREITWEHRAYITPLVHTIEMGVLETGYNKTSGSISATDEGNYRTWDTDMQFDAYISGLDSATFSVFNVSITMDGETIVLGFLTASDGITIEASKTGDVMIGVDWAVNGIDVENGTGTVEIIFDVYPSGGP